MIVSYRRLFMIGFKVSKFAPHDITIVDYAELAQFSGIPQDDRDTSPVYRIYYPQLLAASL